MRRVIRTFIAAILAIFVTAPVFAQAPAQPRNGRAARLQRLSPEQRQGIRQRVAGRRAFRMGRAFKRLDKDANGAISRQEWNRRPEVFDRLDANKDGQLTRQELRQFRARRRG
jgi:hypothetical protein